MTLLARYPVPAFLIISIAVQVAAGLIPSLRVNVGPFDQPLYGSVGTILGVAFAAFLVTAATRGRAGVIDLARRSVRWRVHVGWYAALILAMPVATMLVALAVSGVDAVAHPAGGWPSIIWAFLGLFVLQLIFFQIPEEIGWTGFLQDRWRDRFGPLRLSAAVALPWAVWHLPDFLADAGWSPSVLGEAAIYLAFEIVVLFFARVLLVRIYEGTGRSVLLVAVFHASFDATISRFAADVMPIDPMLRSLVVTAVVVVAAVAVIVVSRLPRSVSAQPFSGRAGDGRPETKSI
jgi:membrane protease YdiL (CAAX protease family)